MCIIRKTKMVTLVVVFIQMRGLIGPVHELLQARIPQAARNSSQIKKQFKSAEAQPGLWGTIALCCMLIFLVSSCASYGIVQNKPKNDTTTAVPYSLQTWGHQQSGRGYHLFSELFWWRNTRCRNGLWCHAGITRYLDCHRWKTRTTA